MTTREFIRLFLPPIYYRVKEKLLPQRIALQESPLPQIKHNSERIIIIGNGPSLNKSVELYKEEILKNDRICVNFFGSSNFYEELKPNIYVFADPAFFWIPDNQKESMEKLFNNIISKTCWHLQIFIPLDAKGAPMEESLLNNKNIKVNYYFNGCQDIGNMSKFEAWDKNLIGPPAMNVLNTATYLALFWNYKETYLIGADSSFLENLIIDQNTNKLYSLDHHFYKRESIYEDSQLFDDKHRRAVGTMLDEELRCQMVAFASYVELRKYANYKDINVYNASEYSWIDAFERKKLC